MGGGSRDQGVLEEVLHSSECVGRSYTGGERAEGRGCTCKDSIGA